MVKHKTLAFFIPHRGCPHQCSFCDQHIISGAADVPKPEGVVHTCQEMLKRSAPLESAEIAFFGGSFTAVETKYQIALLEAVQPFLGEGKFEGIRISTRPDAIDEEVLARLKRYHVTAIELGAQSMSDAVLTANERGHTAQDVCDASAAIREAGFSLGLQQMVGLYGSALEDEYYTLWQLLQCEPDTLRIYPTVVLEGTKLAEYWNSGIYKMMDAEMVLDFCADALRLCAMAGVKVIRLGLHDSPSIRERMVAGYYHPAYRELAEARLYLHVLLDAAVDCGKSELFVETAPRTMSKVLGQRGYNRKYLKEHGLMLYVKESEDVMAGEILVNQKRYSVFETGEK